MTDSTNTDVPYRTSDLPPAVSYDEVIELVAIEAGGAEEESVFQVQDWISAGYGILVYSNHDLGHPMLGHRVFLKVGPNCTITEVPAQGSTIPIQLPDGLMSWRYCLDGCYYNDEDDR